MAAADRDDRHVARLGFHAVDAVGEHAGNACQDRRAQQGVSVGIRAGSPKLALPAATAMSLVVNVVPPNRNASSVRRKPTESGPIVTASVASSRRMRVPPPRPMARISGMRKLVRTPPMSTAIEDSRG